jgi:hypothetical protein
VLTIATIIAFVGYLLVAVFLNIMDTRLMGNAENEIQQAEEQVGTPVPTEALETITPTELSTLSGESAPTTIESTTATPPIGSNENSLPGQE